MSKKETWNLELLEYIKQGELKSSEKAKIQETAIGFQDVDGLKPSKYLIEIAKEHIKGNINIEEAKKRKGKNNMEHEMKLQPEYYNFILNGTKRIEIRLNDEKRQQIKIGDTIKFLKEPELNEYFQAKVIGLIRYNTFEDMFKDFDISILSDKSMTKKELIAVLEQFYTKEKQEQYGVLGIRIELI